MLKAATAEDESVQQAEAPHEFERSSQLFYEADRLSRDQDATVAERKYREAMDATGSYGVFYHLAQGDPSFALSTASITASATFGHSE